MKKRTVETATEVIQALGGAVKTAELLGIDYRVVTNWPARGDVLPPDTYASLGRVLRKKGYKFGLDLFQQRPLIMRRFRYPKRPPPPGRPIVPFRRP